MGEIVDINSGMPIFDIDPKKDEHWDSFLDEVHLVGEAVMRIDGKLFYVKVDDLDDTPPAAA